MAEATRTMDIKDWIAKEAIRSLVDVAKLALDPERTPEAQAMNLGIQSLLIKLVGETQTSAIVANAQIQFREKQRISREEERLRTLKALKEAFADSGEGDPDEMLSCLWESRDEIRSARDVRGPGVLCEALRGAVQTFDDVLTIRYGTAYSEFIACREK